MNNVIVKSEPGFSPSIDAEIFGNANDYIHNDPSGKHMRLDARGVVKYCLPILLSLAPLAEVCTVEGQIDWWPCIYQLHRRSRCHA